MLLVTSKQVARYHLLVTDDVVLLVSCTYGLEFDGCQNTIVSDAVRPLKCRPCTIAVPMSAVLKYIVSVTPSGHVKSTVLARGVTK